MTLLSVGRPARGGAGLSEREVGSSRSAVRLVLFIVIDQYRADYVDRFQPIYESGFRRLLDDSARFTSAYHDHALTKTAPGHASLISGAHPRHHGLIGNDWPDPDTGEEVASVEEDDGTVSPARLLVSTLGDWMRTADPASKVFGVSGKDRGAVTLAGHDATAAYWFDEDVGRFVSSSYYAAANLGRVGGDSRGWSVDHYLGELWELTVEPDLLEAVGARPIDWGDFRRGFPRSMGFARVGPHEEFYEDFEYTPFVDEAVAELAKRLIVAEGLGKDDAPDLLGLSFSAVDRVGHVFGPQSAELIDTVARLDRALGGLLERVDEEVGLDRTVVVVSSDHGVSPLPSELARSGVEARRFYGEDVACFQRLNEKLVERFGPDKWVDWGPFFQREAMARHGLSYERLEQEGRRLLSECPGVEKVWTRSELEGEPPADPAGRLFFNSFQPSRSPDLIPQLKPYSVAWTTRNTTHGTLYPYDRHVPWLIRAPGVDAKVLDLEVATVDIAPTVADLLGVRYPEGLDGVSRRSVLIPAGSERDD